MDKLVIFDFDGVIADSATQYFNVYKATTEHYGKVFPLASVEEFRDWYDSKWEQNFINLGFTEEELPVILNYEGELVNYANVNLFEGIRETLEEMSGKYALAVASTSEKFRIEEKLKQEGLESCFRFISGGGPEGSEKKNIVARALRGAGFEASDALMIGDTVMDILSAKANGLGAIGVTYGWNSAEKLLAAQCDLLAHRPHELTEKADRYFDGRQNQ